MVSSLGALLKVVYDVVDDDDRFGGVACFEKLLAGDSISATAIVTNPDGSWRTRHLRLRARYLKEKLERETLKWKIIHPIDATQDSCKLQLEKMGCLVAVLGAVCQLDASRSTRTAVGAALLATTAAMTWWSSRGSNALQDGSNTVQDGTTAVQDGTNAVKNVVARISNGAEMFSGGDSTRAHLFLLVGRIPTMQAGGSIVSSRHVSRHIGRM